MLLKYNLSYLFLLFNFIISQFYYSVFAQQEDFCKGDTVILRLKGYNSGYIKWQKSTDKQNWEEINILNNDTLSFIVNESCYYRAIVSEGTCKPYYSEIIEITLTSLGTANAGVDQSDVCSPV
ncbi:hypothetical protein ACFLTE_08160, partial [Bacteroidota bacterium]